MPETPLRNTCITVAFLQFLTEGVFKYKYSTLKMNNCSKKKEALVFSSKIEVLTGVPLLSYLNHNH